MRITDNQQRILDELICERLKDNQENEKLIQDFKNEKGELLVEYLKQKGLEEDLEGSTAFYIVKTKNNDILMFFSLKCGELFDHLIDENEVRNSLEEHILIIQALKNTEMGTLAQEKALNKLNEICKAKGISLKEAFNHILDGKYTKHDLLDMLSNEKATEVNENITRVSKTYPGIELMHFCVNENARDIWEAYDLKHSMGEVIFWNKIVPKFFEVQEIVGCEYAFLFAADLSEDRNLINYYNVSLKFDTDQSIGTNKPYYDFSCAFMCQKLSEMKANQEHYFNNFNIDAMDEFV